MATKLNEDGCYGREVEYYVDDNVSTKVVKLIQSYTKIINQKVWNK